MSAKYEVRGSVALITLDNPPVNGLGHDTRTSVVAGLDRALDDAAVQAIVIAGAGKLFCGGADIKEFDSPQALAEPHLWNVLLAIEESSKPVVAAVHGVCMGGGLELALACHYRLAQAGTQVGLPEVKLGLLPGAGGTQRLPRAIGVEHALNVIVSGEPAASELLGQIPGQALFDQVVAGDVLAAALSFAQTHADVRPLPLLRQRTAGHPQADAYFQFARNTVAARDKHFPAPLKCIDAVAAAVNRTFDDGLRFEREAFAALLLTPESKALRHVFMAERALGKVPGVPRDTATRAIAKVAVIGAGTMGAGIAMTFLNAGIPVVVLETSRDALERGAAAMRRTYETQVKKGKLQAEAGERRLSLLSTTLDYAEVKDADLAIEAVFEDMTVKEKVFRALDEVMKPGAILASNTSTLDLDRLAAFTRRAQDVIGMHFFSPAPVMKLLEVVRGDKTSHEVLATVMQLGKTIEKTCVVSGVCDGFIGNRMIEQYSRQAGFLLEEGATPQQVDQAIEDFGFAMGPFRMSDLAGNDVSWSIRKRRYVEKPQLRYSKLGDLLCEQGRFGQKTAAGWYDYAPGQREARVSPRVQALIERHRQALGISPRRISSDEIVQRLVYALVNEGARIVEEGIALRASDIDIVYLAGYGFPRWRGGPLCYADTVGLANVVRTMKRFARNAHDDAQFWQPAALLARLAAQGHGFSTRLEQAIQRKAVP